MHINLVCFFVFQVGLISGTAFMFIGLTVLVVGFLVPPKIEALGKDDFVVVDTRAIQFNGSLDICKLAGAILFCVGGSSVAVCLLMSAFAKSYSKEEKYLQQRFKERIADIKAHANPVTKAPAPGESKIPVTLSKFKMSNLYLKPDPSLRFCFSPVDHLNWKISAVVGIRASQLQHPVLFYTNTQLRGKLLQYKFRIGKREMM